MTDPLAPGSTIGILGGGQLGRMLALAAARLGLKAHIYDPAAGGPAEQVADRTTVAAYDDAAALQAFARAVDVVTYEFENIPTSALDLLEQHRPIRPTRRPSTGSGTPWTTISPPRRRWPWSSTRSARRTRP